MLLNREYIACALLKAKYEIFNDEFITFSELNLFTSFIQKKFNEHELGIAITSNRLNPEIFNINRDIITLTGRGYYNLYRLSSDILSILTDNDLLIEFFMDLENRKLAILQNKKQEILATIKTDEVPKELKKENIKRMV